MAPITDISWTKLNEALKKRLGTTAELIVFDESGRPSTINITPIVQNFPMIIENTQEDEAGVIKFLGVVLDACNDVQVEVNSNVAVGDRLGAFTAPTPGAPAGTLVPITRTMIARADLSSVTKVVGRNV